MGIDAINSNQFLTLTRPINGMGEENIAYHRGRVSNPYENGSLFENIDRLEARKGEKFTTESPTMAQASSRGEAWYGFEVPANNGTGELRPKVDGFNYYA